jgi:hypothetical protein
VLFRAEASRSPGQRERAEQRGEVGGVSEAAGVERQRMEGAALKMDKSWPVQLHGI